MTWNLDGLTVRGEIDNSRPHSVTGWLKLAGEPIPLTLTLTGDCGRELRGKRFRFESPRALSGRPAIASLSDDEVAWQQVGPTGSINLERNGDGAPLRLEIEWFGQNGRVVMRMTKPVIEFVTEEVSDLETPPGRDAGRPRPDEPTDLDGPHTDPTAWEGQSSEDADDDPYELFPAELHRMFDADAKHVDAAAVGDEECGRTIHEIELMEEAIENGEGVPVCDVLDPPLRLPKPEQATDGEIDVALKALLARLAKHGIAFEICEHFTVREAYALLVEEICPHELTHPSLDAKRWVQQFSTSDFCDKCDAELDAELDQIDDEAEGDI